jgi:hypothetical protein
MKRTSIINEKRKRRKDKTNTKEAKRRHFHVKQTRSSKTASKEICNPLISVSFKKFFHA